MMKKFFYLTVVAFIISVLHACSLNNNILTPDCKVFEADLVDRWWFQVGQNKENGIYFSSAGRCMKRNSSDSLTYTLTGCNKLNITNHTTFSHEVLEIGKLRPEKASMLIGGKIVDFATRPE
jgi:hypothetical protein